MAKRSTPVPVPLILSARAWDVLAFLFGAHPLPIPTATLARAFFTGHTGSSRTIEKSAWRFLNRLRAQGLVATTTGLTLSGRSPAYWYLQGPGMAALTSTGRVSAADLAEKPSIHKSGHTLLKRRHDLFVHDVKAELLALCRQEPALALRLVAHDTSTWDTLPGHESAGPVVAPDLVASLGVGDTELVLFVEVQGTASSLSAVETKVSGYLAYLESGQAEARYRCRNFRVLFVSFSDDPAGGVDHLHNVLEAAAEVPDGGTLVYGTTVDRLAADGLGGAIWLRPCDLVSAIHQGANGLSSNVARTRHAGNAVRAARDRRVTAHSRLRTLFE